MSYKKEKYHNTHRMRKRKESEIQGGEEGKNRGQSLLTAAQENESYILGVDLPEEIQRGSLWISARERKEI